jgi:fructose-bisphosphate aldolase / 2-amino-3,7-dideoxy-D-threo-hept-6-ulosonate synthase
MSMEAYKNFAINTGKTIRLKRIFDKNGKAVLFAPVHNMTSPKPYGGQIDVSESVKKAVAGEATAMVMSKGFLRNSATDWDGSVGILNYLFTYTALGTDPIRQVIISSVEESARMGADGVCFFVGLSSKNDAEVLELLGKVGDLCDRYGLIFAAEAEFPGFYDSQEEHLKKHGISYLKYTARVCAELGCDLVSTNWTGSVESFRELVDYVKIPVLLNGGPKMPEKSFLEMIEKSVKAGASGCLVGRNFSEAKDIEKIVRAASGIIREGKTAEQVF